MRTLNHLNKFRDKKAERALIPPGQPNYRVGVFNIPLRSGVGARIIFDNGLQEADWEHVSVTLIQEERTPTWEEMCEIKDLFFEKEEAVVQFHPKESEYVNVMENCLHLWRYKGEFPRPSPLSVL